jgi:hypothetical protein
LDEELEAAEELGALVDGRGTSFERLISGYPRGCAQSVALGVNLRSRRQVEIALARIVVGHFRRQGLLSWGSVTVANVTPGYVAFNNLPFCATGYNWLKPLIREGKNGKPAPTPMVFDVRATTCSEDDVRSLLDRVARAGYNSRIRLPILASVAAPDFDSKGWQQARKNGFVAANLNDMFGHRALDAMVIVEEIFKGIVGNPERLDEGVIADLCASLEELKTNPVLVDLRSLAFESVSGLILRSQGWEGVELALSVPFHASTRDIDVYGSRNGRQTAKLVECKAASTEKQLEPLDVEKFFTQTVPAFLRSKGHDDHVEECEAEIWTTGIVGREASDRLNSIKVDRRVRPKIVGGRELLASVPNGLRRSRELLRVISLAI